MKLLLIDGNSVLFRGFYATSYGSIMKSSKGVYTNAVYAFANMMEKAFREIKPDYCVVAFDKGKHTFRHELNPDYKGGRRETPEELVGQFALVREMLQGYGISFLEYDDIEADDVIGTLSKKYPIETCILSSDRDLLQLIDDTTSVYIMKKGMSEIAKMNGEALKEEYGLLPYQIIDWKGLAGDKSDNIKGVEGVGDKTAVKLLNQYDTCEGIYEHIDEIKGKLKERLINDKDSCFLSKQLATIKTDVAIDLPLEDFSFRIDEEGRNAFFEKYEMYSLINKIEKKTEPVLSVEKVSRVSKEALEEPFVYFMSNDFSYYERELWGLCFVSEKKREYIGKEDFLKDEQARAFLASDEKKYVYDLKALLHLANYQGFAIGKNTEDMMLMGFLLNNDLTTPKKILAYYHIPMDQELKDITGTEKRPLPYDEEKVMTYSGDFAGKFKEIASRLGKDLRRDELEELYHGLELPLTYTLYEMEKEGIACDIGELDRIASLTRSKMEEAQKRVYEEAGHDFNISSPKQLSEVLFKELDLPNLKNGSTGAEILQKLTDYHPIIKDILEYRKYSKLYSTYAEGLKKYIRSDGKIHTIFSQNITATGRLSSYDPNLQNISVRDDESREIRRAFKPAEGAYFLSCDYSQIELRVLASLADEQKMIDAFNSGVDIHEKTAMDVFGLKEGEVTPLDRRHAKAVNFGVVYGISDFGLANQTNLSFKDAKKFIDNYFETYPAIKAFLDQQVENCQRDGYVSTILKRRRYISEIHDRNYMMREFGKRAAMNSTIQGSAADIIKIAMNRMSQALKEKGLRSKLLLQVHDELIFEVPEEELEIMQELVKDVMAHAYPLKVRLDSSMSIGKTWYEAK